MEYRVTYNGREEQLTFSQVKNDFQLTMSEQIKVANLKPGQVIVFEYAKPITVERLP